jgi:hypothetical protein
MARPAGPRPGVLETHPFNESGGVGSYAYGPFIPPPADYNPHKVKVGERTVLDTSNLRGQSHPSAPMRAPRVSTTTQWEHQSSQKQSIQHKSIFEMSDDELHEHNRSEHGALNSHGLPRTIHERTHELLHGVRVEASPGEGAGTNYNPHPILAPHSHASRPATAVPAPSAPKKARSTSRWDNLPTVTKEVGGRK